MKTFILYPIKEIAKEKEQGTKLLIEDLREWWSESMIKRVYRYAIDVIQPFPLSKKEERKEGEIVDPGFEILCSKDGNEIANQQSMFYQHALAEIEGYVDENGNGYWMINKSKVDATTKTDIKLEDDEDENQFSHLMGVRFKAYYFIYNAGLITKQAESYMSRSSQRTRRYKIVS